MENTQIKRRDILHCDLNNFYASVEIRDNPSLAGLPVAVGGSVEERNGIILAKNYIAKDYGVKTAEPLFEAKRKCPNLIILPPRMEEYSRMSKIVREIYARFTDMIEPFGMDECWLDVTGSHYLFGSSEEIAYKIKETVKEETGLTISVGVSFTKVLAKLGSDLKKPDAVTVLSEENYKKKIYGLKANEIIGIGPATMKKLEKIRIHTIGELAESDPDMIIRHLGKNGMYLWRAVNGYDDSRVHEYGYKEEAKSMGNSTTLKYDLYENRQVWQVMLSLAEEVCRRLRADGQCACGVCISVKTNDLDYHEFQTRLDFPTNSSLMMAETGFRLFIKNFDWHRPIRALGIRGINLESEDIERQCTLFADTEKTQKLEALDRVSDSLRKRFGRDVIYPATLQNDLFLTHEKIRTFEGSHSYSL